MHQADQSDRTQLQTIVEKRLKHEIFFIIDDGSHIPEHQVLSFDYLFAACLAPGGTYIIARDFDSFVLWYEKFSLNL